MGTQNGKYVVLKDWSTEEWANKDEDYVEYSDYSTDYFYPRALIYLIPNTFLGAELTGVKISGCENVFLQHKIYRLDIEINMS